MKSAIGQGKLLTESAFGWNFEQLTHEGVK